MTATKTINYPNALDMAKKTSSWIERHQHKPLVGISRQSRVKANWGAFSWIKGPGYNFETVTPSWAGAFSSMACFAAYQTFHDPKYLTAVDRGIRYLQSLQVFEPYNKKHYGAFREHTPLTSWCYVRDASSVAWVMAQLYRDLKTPSYLECALHYYDWFLREGLDEDGYPRWGVNLDDTKLNYVTPEENHHLQGVFHGGTLNLFYQLYKATGDKKFVGKEFINLADLIIDRIQQPNGSFQTFDTITMKPVEADPQANLHIGNDDFNTLGLLCAFEITKNQKYINGIEHFLDFILNSLDKDTGFGEQRSALPVVLNILIEMENYFKTPNRFKDEKESIVKLINYYQQDSNDNDLNGGILESSEHSYACARATSYSTIALLKYEGKVKSLLGVS